MEAEVFATKSFLRTGALFSVLSAVTTTVLIFGPDPATPSGFDAVQALHANALHIYKKWILFLHPQFAFIAALAAGSLIAKRSPALVTIALFYFAIWTITEVTQQAYLIDALNQIWRPAYLAAAGEGQTQWRTLITGMQGISDSQYFVLLFGFSIGSILMGIAFAKERGTAKVIGYINCTIGFMSLLAFTSYYTALSGTGGIIGGWYTWIYPPVQIGVRLLLAWWLFQQSNQLMSQRAVTDRIQ